MVVSGASGLIGSALVDALRADGMQVQRLVRRTARGADEIEWHPDEGRLDPAPLEGVDAVVHLAGAGIGDKRWTGEYKQLLRDSRVGSTTLLSRTVAGLTNPPRVMLSASAIGYYGECGEEPVNEAAAPGEGFLADLVVDWESAATPAEAAGIRVVHLRSGIVLSRRGGALARMLPIFKLGAGGKLGSGRQWWSWVALPDEIAATRFLLDADVRGPVNVTSPEPARNAELTKVLADVLGRPALLTVPAFALRLAFGEFADSGLLWSQRVIPQKLLDAGFTFAHPDLEPALRELL